MIENENKNVNINDDEIDLVDFSSNREMDRIRENERIEREKRLRRAKEIRRAEIIRRKKIAAIKQAVVAWTVLIVGAVVVISGITTLVKVINRDDSPKQADVGDAISDEDMAFVEKFQNGKKNLITSGEYSSLDDMVKAVFVPVDYNELVKERSSYLGMASEVLLWNGNMDIASFVATVRNYPIYQNGYVWSSKDSMKSPVTEGYLYDTNASYVSAVANICLWQGNTSFLGMLDDDGEKNGDVSNGKTVGEKLELVAGHFFDEEDVLNGGGVRYNKNDKLLYIKTETNGGGGEDKPSNIFFNHRFGFLDLYSNLTFNKAMRDLSALYKLSGDMEKAEYYEQIVNDNKAAINSKFYDKEKGRFIGCIDNEGAVHDGGFVGLNLFAVSLDICNEERTNKIMSWLESEEAFKNKFLPTFSTIPATDSWWDYRDGNYPLSGSARFGEYWQNGKESAISGYYDLLTKKTKVDAADRVKVLSNAYKDGAFKLPKKDEKSFNEPQLHYGAYVGEAVKKFYGISTDGKTLAINPAFDIRTDMGIKNVSFSNRSYSVAYDENAVFLFSNVNSAVKINLGGFDAEESVDVVTVVDNAVEKTETVKADKNGTVSLSKKFGDTSFVKIERQPVKEEK